MLPYGDPDLMLLIGREGNLNHWDLLFYPKFTFASWMSYHSVWKMYFDSKGLNIFCFTDETQQQNVPIVHKEVWISQNYMYRDLILTEDLVLNLFAQMFQIRTFSMVSVHSIQYLISMVISIAEYPHILKRKAKIALITLQCTGAGDKCYTYLFMSLFYNYKFLCKSHGLT